jgi:hypothetical protein
VDFQRPTGEETDISKNSHREKGEENKKQSKQAMGGLENPIPGNTQPSQIPSGSVFHPGTPLAIESPIPIHRTPPTTLSLSLFLSIA